MENQGQKYFTVREASRLLPELSRIVRYLQGLKAEIKAKSVALRQARAKALSEGVDVTRDPFFEAESELEFLALIARSQVEEIQSMGAQLKDIDEGLVDFATYIGGDEAYLCWKLGEPEIGYWHGVEEGARGRKPLPPELLYEGPDGEAE